MPNYQGHLVGGAVSYMLGCMTVLFFAKTVIASPLVGLEWLFFTLAGSLFPDIDTKSKGQKYFYWLLLGCLLFFIYKNEIKIVIFLSIASILPMLVKHRGLFHRTWFIVGCPIIATVLLCKFFPNNAVIIMYDMFFFIIGILSHLWLDLGWRRMLQL